ncbi:hypothetical protein K402DRAFT_396099 [Aulographum hederae CBS 113979]|uniref:Uncharacterized protein n=1 Tax=Aulographum hederae CBS 113979 TaxID=1176131 RepID=A0A6G1GSY9_9PEZI|nr:hypothetical protein K402DRAFT_396099 [Aulographum hederae CBS 113979]
MNATASKEPADLDSQQNLEHEGPAMESRSEAFDSSEDEADRDLSRRAAQSKKDKHHARFGSPNRKVERKQRRFTFERLDSELKLVEHVTREEGGYENFERAKFTNAQEFQAAIERGGIDGAFGALIASINDLALANQQVQECQERLRALGEENGQMKKEIRELTSLVAQQEMDAVRAQEENESQARDLDRVRKTKTQHRLERNDALLKVIELEKQISKKPARTEPQDSSEDEEDPNLEAIRNALRRTGTPFSTTSRPERSSSKWPDIKEYFGDTEKQRDEYPQWRQSIFSKFRNSFDMFTSESSKIDYVRDKCKSTAFSIIESFDEMIKDLDDMFAEYNPQAKADAQLHNTNFAMKKNERFEVFLARFTKITACKRLLSASLRNKISDGTAYISYPEFIRRCKQCDIDIGNPPKKPTGQENPAPTRPAQIFNRLKTTGACYKCGEKGHRHWTATAPSKLLATDVAELPDNQSENE